MTLRSKKIFVWLSASAAALILSSCGTAAPNVAAKAELDTTSMQIIFPLDNYGMSWKEVAKVNYANEVAADKCMRKSGSSNPLLQYLNPHKVPSPMWRYGFWNQSFVAKYGAGPDPVDTPGDKALAADEQRYALYIACSTSDSLKVLDAAQTYQGEPPSALAQAANQGYEKAFSSDAGKEAKKKLTECLAKVGFSLLPGATSIGVQTDENWSVEQSFKALVADAKCADQLGTVQSMANLEASYQQQYINEHEAEFKAIREQRDEIMKKADALISQSG